MKRYFKNLLSALLGNDPYQVEYDDLKEKLTKTEASVCGLNELYYKSTVMWEADKKQAASLQQLVENLRERIADKDIAINLLQQDYQERVREVLACEVDALKGELQLAQKKEVTF